MKFRKKPVVIEAMRYQRNSPDILNFVGRDRAAWDELSGTIYIKTLEGSMRANQGDWIIKGVKGEFYPCKHEIFEATYEAVK